MKIYERIIYSSNWCFSMCSRRNNSIQCSTETMKTNPLAIRSSPPQNLKKSWHPNTIKNQERVWRAEQADAAEKRKLAELKQEISAERDRDELYRIGKSSGVLPAGGGLGSGSLGGGGVDGGGGNSGSGAKKLEWMYRGAENLLNREEYLLGRQVDKSFEKQEAAEREAKQKQMVGVTQPKNHVEHECIPFSIRQFHGASAVSGIFSIEDVMTGRCD